VTDESMSWRRLALAWTAFVGFMVARRLFTHGEKGQKLGVVPA
jgi:hypothetical protein